MSAELVHDSRITRLIEIALMEDASMGDLTSEAIIPEDQLSSATFLCKANGVVSGLDVAGLVFRLVDSSVTLEPAVREGAAVSHGMALGSLHGPTRGILLGERTALNILQRMSGIASLTRRYINAVAGTGARITDTRKTVPGMRALDKRAVLAGGGVNHRFGLDDMVLIKDNHIAAGGGITAAVKRCQAYLHDRDIAVAIEVETTTLDQVREALACPGIARIMLDNFRVDEMREAVRLIGRAVETEASGGVTLETVRAIAETGVDLISVGALTHSVTALDISLELSAHV